MVYKCLHPIDTMSIHHHEQHRAIFGSIKGVRVVLNQLKPVHVLNIML